MKHQITLSYDNVEYIMLHLNYSNFKFAIYMIILYESIELPFVLIIFKFQISFILFVFNRSFYISKEIKINVLHTTLQNSLSLTWTFLNTVVSKYSAIIRFLDFAFAIQPSAIEMYIQRQ